MTAARTATVAAPSRRLVVAGAALAAFGVLLTVVSSHPGPLGVDTSLLHLFERHRSPGLSTFAKAITTLGAPAVVEIIVGVIALLLAIPARNWRPVLLGVVCVVGAQTASSALKRLVGRPRHGVADRVGRISAHGMAFPPGHATAAAAGFTVLTLLLAQRTTRTALRTAIVTVAGALFVGVGWSRVHLGVHWPSDVLSGWLLGLGWTFAVVAIVDALVERLRTDTPSPRPIESSLGAPAHLAPPDPRVGDR